MITKQQAINLRHNQELHYTGKTFCTMIFGPRGGATEKIERARVSGKSQTWKTRPDEFRLPVKHGLYENGAVTHLNKNDFHLAGECPLFKEEVVF